MKPLSLTSALEEAGMTYGDLAASMEKSPSTVWRWCSLADKHCNRQPTAAELDTIGDTLGLGVVRQKRLALWFRLRQEGALVQAGEE